MCSRESNEERSKEELVKFIQYNYPDSLIADGFDSCIIGVAEGHDSGRIIYDISKMAKVLTDEEGMSLEEAYEYLYFNTIGSYISEDQPIYVDLDLN